MRDKIVELTEVKKLVSKIRTIFVVTGHTWLIILDFYDDVYANWDVRLTYDVIYLDFQKAFDTVPHNRLISKLQSDGLEEHLSTWIRGWLSNRFQRVDLNGEAYDCLHVTSGVLQGCSTVPTLFMIHVNDLKNHLLSKVSKFADDRKVKHEARMTVGKFERT